MKTNIHFWSYRAHFFLEWKLFPTKVVEKIKTHILCSVTFFRKSCRLWDKVEKYCRTGQATDDKMAHAHCMLDTQGYKHTLRICNIYWFFSTEKKWLLERYSVLRYKYTACLSVFLFYLSCSTSELTIPAINAEADDKRISVTQILYCDFCFCLQDTAATKNVMPS